MKRDKINRTKEIFEKYGPVIKTCTLRENNIFSRDISKLIADGIIRKIKPGYYVWISEEYNITEIELVSALFPKGIICLESAAFYHELSTINPVEISIAIQSGSTIPKLPDYPPVKVVTVQTKYFELGIKEEENNYSNIRIYNKERTVCDFFKKRNQLGEDLALEVLKNYMKGKRQLQLLMSLAAQMRVKTIIKPYVEALI